MEDKSRILTNVKLKSQKEKRKKVGQRQYLPKKKIGQKVLPNPKRRLGRDIRDEIFKD